MKRRWFCGCALFLVSLIFLPNCTNKSQCIPNETAKCLCLAELSGVQTCREDGTYTSCVCASTSQEVAKEKSSNEKTVVEKYERFDSDASLPENKRDILQEVIPETPPTDGNSSTLQGLEFFQKIAGLWVGSAQNTPLSDFPLMYMDIQNADENILFSRADLDSKNNLRFAFLIEKHKGKDVLVYRNGGYFQGFLRDTRTQLIEWDAKKQVAKFCEVTQGCDYLEATFSFASADSLTLQVFVGKKQHLTWKATRKETRTLPNPFPKVLTAQGTGSDPFPTMASVELNVSWSQPLKDDAQILVLLTSTACYPTFQCNASRSYLHKVNKGLVSTQIFLEQVHQGSYFVNVILDRNNNIHTSFFPDSGDTLAIPDAKLTIQGKTKHSHSSVLAITAP